MRKFALAASAAALLGAGVLAVTVTTTPDRQDTTTVPSSQNDPEDPTDLEEPFIDGPEPLTREEFAEDSRTDSNTVTSPLQRLPEDPAVPGGNDVTAERTEP